jgi:hypothetical protein
MFEMIDLDGLNHFVLRKQHLANGSKIDDIVQVVKDIVGLHATGFKAPYLSLFARTRNFVKEHLNEELYVKRNLGKIPCMRATLYILTKEMIPIAYLATRKRLEELSKRYAEFRGVSSEEYEVLSKTILKILKGREMTAPEIRKVLNTQLDVSAILYLMCDQGLLIRGRPRRYALFHEYFPNMDLTKMSEVEARTLLVQHYLSSFGPVTENDIVWWISLSKTKVREALNNLQKQIVRVKISSLKGNFLLLRSDENLIKNASLPEKRTVNLLPSLDPYLMGYKERERYLHHKHHDRVFDRSGNITSTILVDGKVVGIWDFADDEDPFVKLFLLEEIEGSMLREIYLEAQKIGKFICAREVQIKECDSVIPLTRRTAGGFMSPLKGC